MKIWTGKICRLLITLTLVVGAGCTTTGVHGQSETSLKSDRTEIENLRKDIPEETRKSNDRLAEMLKRWKDQKMAPDVLRERFNDEIMKKRAEMEKHHRRLREDFSRIEADKRREFQDNQKEAREKFLSSKPASEKRQTFMSRQSEDRDRFNSDMRDARDEFEDHIREQRKAFESDIADRWSEFRGEFPDYVKTYNAAKAAAEKAAEEKAAREAVEKSGTKPVTGDVNKGGDGWPATN